MDRNGIQKSNVTFQHALFENTRKLPPNTSMCSTERSDISSVSEAHHRVQPSRIPTEPWQVTKKHLNLTPEEIVSLGSGEPGHTSEDMNAKVLKVSHTIMIISFWTGRSRQTVQTQIRLLLEEQSDQGLHCLPFRNIISFTIFGHIFLW